MLTLTTHADGTRGFAVYVDGVLVGQQPSAFSSGEWSRCLVLARLGQLVGKDRWID